MRCYKHPKKEAVGMCKVCNKGLCSECAVEVDDFLFCQKHATMDKAVKHAEQEALGEIAPPEVTYARAEEMRTPARPAKVPARFLPPKRTLMIEAQSLLTPALVGGIISGTPSGIPFLNFLCIFWMILGGAAAAYLLLLKESSKYSGMRSKLRYSDAIFTGALSGIFGGSIAFLFGMFSGINFWQGMLDLLLSAGLDYNLADMFLRLMVVDPQLDILPLFAKWLLMLVIFPIFGAIGGAIAAKLSD